MRQKVRDSLCKGNFLRACRKQSGLILPIAFAIIFVVLLYDFSSQRIISQNKLSKQSKNTDLILAENMPESMSTDKDASLISRNLTAEISEKNVWCQARDYQDLSNDPVILEFQIWAEQLRNLVCLTEKDSCLDHDPRFLHAFFNKGEELAEARKPIFSQIIRGNPRKALELAVSRNLRSVLPPNITAHLEQWESEVVDIRSVHLCFTDYHPGGYVKTTASFPDGRKLRTWSFGGRYKLPIRKGLAVWGISLGEDLAISDRPYQVFEKDEQSGVIEFAGESITYNGTAERDLLLHEIDVAEDRYRSRRGSIHKIMYPTALASSMTADAILEAKYELNTTRATFDEAQASAISKNGYLLQFKDEVENKLIQEWLKEKHEENQLFTGLDESNASVSLLWLGGTDNEEVNGTTFDRETNTTSQNREINASEGEWKWLNGESWSYQNWRTGFGIERNSTTQDFAAFDWNETNGTWVDINETARLPFIIEKENDVATIESDLKGIRKVLVVPARFLDETVYYKSVLGGSNFLLTNEFDEEILQELKADSYEPASRAEIERAMQTVREYFSRNTDGELDLVPVITPTVTMISSEFFPLEPPVTRYVPINEKGVVYPGYSSSYRSTTTGPNLFDSEGNFTTLAEAVYQELPEDPDLPSIDVLAMAAAAEQSEDWNFEGFAFVGLSSLSLAGSSIDTNFSSPPTVKIVGGEAPNAQGLPHPRFRAAEAEVFLDEDGDVIGASVLEPGAYYMDGATPQIFLNGVDYTDDFVSTVEYILVSTVALTNYSAGAAGMGWIGGAGTVVQVTDGNVPEGTVAHEIGHNFGLWHSNTYNPRSEHPLSDDADIVEYGNEFSVMGVGKNIAESGDLSAPEKVRLNIFFDGQSGYNKGNALGDDVADLTDEATLETSLLKETNSTVANTFRVYRSNYGSPPRKLREIAFSLKLPEEEEEFLQDLGGTPYPVQFDGAGGEAEGYLDLTDMELVITEGGRGFVQEPLVRILDENDSVLMTLNPAWMVVPNGRDFNQTATLLSFAPEDRWIRGVRISGATGLVRPTNLNPEGLLGTSLTDYYITYRTDFSEHGIMLEVANDPDEANGHLEPFLLDATPNTPRNNDTDFNDDALLVGSTYSDYDADIHITPVKVGGKDPMPYIECVVNMGSVSAGEAQAPEFELTVSNRTPSPKEFIEFSATVEDGNASQYAYAWFVNEQPLHHRIYLNQPAINYQFAEAGRFVIRAVVTDMRGGVSSRNLIVTVQGDELTNKSMLSGTVKSTEGPLQGARVILEKSQVIDHNVSLEGNLYDSFFVDGMNNPARFKIDGMDSPTLLFRRGEIHRFYFDKSIEGVTMSFLQKPENTTPRVHINMISDPRADLTVGSKYFRNPEISYRFNSTFSNYLTNQVGTYLEMLNFLYEHNGTVVNLEDTNGTTLELLEYLEAQTLNTFEDDKNLITRPYARALMQETNISTAVVGPTEITELGYLAYGGRGYSRTDPPVMTVRRKSIWEDYSKRDANGTALVDGVNTISPVIAEDFLGPTWITRPNDSIEPKLIVWGSGGGNTGDENAEVNATVTSWENNGDPMRTINISNQGKGFEPNSTMAVLHYPIEPFAYWTFDRHETLFEDSSEARYQPSPAWNREHKAPSLAEYWSFEEDVAGVSGDPVLDEDNFENWGLLGKCISLEPSQEITAIVSLDANFTFSIWFNALDTFEVVIAGETLTIEPRVPNNWSHLAIVKGDNSAFYIDGRKVSQSISDGDDIVITNLATTDLLLDEARLYSESMGNRGVNYLAGKSFLDLSGHKYHLVTAGTNSILTSPDLNMSSSNIPSGDPINGSEHGSGSLGNSFTSEDNGKSVVFDGSTQYLDLKMHKGEFALPQGTISLWVYPEIEQGAAPLFSLGSPYQAQVKDGNSSENELLSPGALFSFELLNGWPRIAGYRAFRSQDKLTTNQWHHLVGTFPEGKIWVNGIEVPTLLATTGNSEFEEYVDLLNSSIDASFFRIGYSYDRTALDPLPLTPPEAYFNGNLDDVAIYDRILDVNEINFLYELRRGREQLPRLEAVVDAVGTTTVVDGGEGYRENPNVVFWYGSEENKTDLNNSSSLAQLKLTLTEDNATHGLFAYVEDEGVVYSYHYGKSSDRQYNWRKGDANGWRKHVPATGIGEFGDASLGDVVWAKKMDTPTDVPMPDGRVIPKRYMDLVTMDLENSFALERNGSATWPYSYYKPNGIYGFVEQVTLDVGLPAVHNPDAQSFNAAEAFVHFYIDADANESISIIDAGIGASTIPLDNIKISGSGYQPATPDQNEEEHSGFAEIDTNLQATGQVGWGPFVQYDWNGSEDVNISALEFNKTYLSVDVNNPGFDYAMPLEFKVIGGRPQVYDDFFMTPLPEYNSSDGYVFEEAEFAVTSMGANGSIESIEVTKMGQGYVDYGQLSGDDRELFGLLLADQGYDLANYPLIMVTGGGGHGATFKATVDANGSITGTTPISGGSGYVNTLSNNRPRLIHTPTLEPGERNASLEVMLGGYLKEIPRCTDCEAGTVHGKTFSHTEPWIEIWDRGRKEEDIDSMGARAHAAPKVVNGKIEKVIVTSSGTGYIDPVVMVRDAPPNHATYSKNKGRKWKCTFKRSLPTGEKVECGHIQVGLYPPEECPGETDATLPYVDANGSLVIATGDQLQAWRERHAIDHNMCSESDFHLAAQFLVRKCWGTKMNYILHDDALYRTPRADWAHLDANLSIISKNGRIREIVVENSGSNYYASQIFVEGTGAGVDAIPVFDNLGVNTEVIFDDPRIKNLEFDRVSRPLGAGQGFRERPWAWDESPRTAGYSAVVEDNDPLWGEDERVDVIVIHSELKATWNFGQPILADYTGDRIMEVDIVDPGLYNADKNLTVTLEYNSSGSLDQNKDGVADFVEGSVAEWSTTRLTKFSLDDNASYDFNDSGIIIERGLFDENPRVQILDGRNVSGAKNITYSTETGTSFIRNNDKISYNANPDKGYIELYIDDRFPAQLYYGEGITTGDTTMVVPAFGGKIIVTDPVPGGSWALDEVLTKPNFSYTDQNGYFAFTGLDWGIYNAAVFLEDQKFQESTFRPDINPTLVSQFVYIPGFPDLVLETDNFGKGQSALLWSRESRSLSRSSTGPSDKSLSGIGRGFDPSKDPPEILIFPDPNNRVTTRPAIEVGVLVDGSLSLNIIDDENTTKYFPDDRFTIRYAGVVTGLDFTESSFHSETNQTFNSGILSSLDYDDSLTDMDKYQGMARLVISPNDGDLMNPIDATLSTEASGNAANKFRARVFEADGTEVDASNVKWSYFLDFNSSDGNKSRVCLLESASGERDISASGAEIDLFLFSTLRSDTGSIQRVEVISGGAGYSAGDTLSLNSTSGYGFEANVSEVNSTGSITEIQVIKNGYDYSERNPSFSMSNSSSGTGAIFDFIKPVGYLTLEANITLASGDVVHDAVRVRPSLRHHLSSKEKWLDKYLDSFAILDDGWWQQEENSSNTLQDPDDDNLTNFSEWMYGTNPLDADTDNDRLDDYEESLLGSKPTIYDTDGDGLNDYDENASGTNVLMMDTDGDGLIDSNDSNPTDATGVGIVSGRIFSISKYSSPSLYFRFSLTEDINATDWVDSWKYSPKFFNKDSLNYGQSYTVQVYLDTTGEGNYSQGEPFDEEVIPLENNVYGINLVPTDPIPDIYFEESTDDNFSHFTIDVQDTNLSNEFQWGVVAEDPYYSISDESSKWYMDSNYSNRHIELEGNLTDYLLGLPESGYQFPPLMTIDLEAAPVGAYKLFYKAKDSFSNYSRTLEQTIILNDTQPPFITILDFENNRGLTTELESTFDQVYNDLDLENFPEIEPDFIPQADGNGTLTWERGTSFVLDNLYVKVRDNKSGDVDWDVSYDGSAEEDLKDAVLLGLYDLNFTAVDDSQNQMNFVLRVEVVDTEDPSVVISGDAVDENNRISVYRKIGAYLEDEISIFADDSQGTYSEVVNYYEDNSSFSVDWGDLNYTREGNKTLLLPGDEDNYTITFSYSDESNNVGSAELIIVSENPRLEIAGYAMDGYLALSDVSLANHSEELVAMETTTDDNGYFSFLLTDADFDGLDTNGNEVLELSEARLRVRGGIDLDTGTDFLGMVWSDWNTSIVSPLTSLVASLMEAGMDKGEANGAVLTFFGLNQSIDLSTYDPLSITSQDDVNSIAVLRANYGLANLTNQLEAVFDTYSDLGFYQHGEISLAVMGELANRISQGETSFVTIIPEILEVGVNSISYVHPLSEDTLGSFDISVLIDLILEGDNTNLVLEGTVQEQRQHLLDFHIWSHENIISELVQGINERPLEPLSSIGGTVLDTLESIGLNERRVWTFNLFAPEASSFRRRIAPIYVEDDCIIEIESSDGDGDEVLHTLVSGNVDLDGDGKPAFHLTTEGKLCLYDEDEIDYISGQTFRLIFSLNDGYGRIKTIDGIIEVDSRLIFESQNLSGSWYNSNWLGIFNYTGLGWIYHQKLGWAYLRDDGGGGFWFWDTSWNGWWWTKEGIFPWIYRDDSSNWHYLDIKPDDVRVYDSQQMIWSIRK